MPLVQMLNMTFDIWSAFFDLILILGVAVSNLSAQRQARMLTSTLLSNVSVNVFEALAYFFRGDPSEIGWWMVRVTNFGVFFCNHLLLLFGAAYIIQMIENADRPVSIWVKRAVNIVILAGVILLVLSRFYGFYYTFDEQNVYHRAAGYSIMLIPHFIVTALMLVITLLNFKYLDRVGRNAIILFEVLPLISIVAQAFTYGISLTTFASTISLTVMFIAYELDCSRAMVKRERRLLNEVISALSKAVDAKDAYTRGHSARVAKYAQMIAEHMELSEEDRERIYRMAILHDVGKIGIPDAVLNKPGKLSDEEFALIKSHAAHGGAILGKVDDMPELATAARWHHERYDGGGYPDGIAGDQIPLEVRIIGMADCYDAMTSDRVYRDHLPQDVVRREIVRGTGTQFDPLVAQIMLKIIDEDKDYELRE